MAKIDKIYHDLLLDILQRGYTYKDPNREGVKRTELSRYTLEYDMSEGFPAITTKKLWFRSVAVELIWFLRGGINIKYLNDRGVRIWDKDSAKFSDEGYVGRIYGSQWRSFGDGVDQIQELIDGMIKTPMSSELIVTAWHPGEKDQMALPPCHKGFQVMCRPHGNTYSFDLIWEQRSVDTFLGLPFNIASYALLMELLAKITGYIPGKLYGDLRKVHIYDNAIDAVKEQLARDTNKYDNKCRIAFFHDIKDHYEYHGLDSLLEGIEPLEISLRKYESFPSIRVEMLERD